MVPEAGLNAADGMRPSEPWSRQGTSHGSALGTRFVETVQYSTVLVGTPDPPPRDEAAGMIRSTDRVRGLGPNKLYQWDVQAGMTETWAWTTTALYDYVCGGKSSPPASAARAAPFSLRTTCAFSIQTEEGVDQQNTQYGRASALHSPTSSLDPPKTHQIEFAWKAGKTTGQSFVPWRRYGGPSGSLSSLPGPVVQLMSRIHGLAQLHLLYAAHQQPLHVWASRGGRG
jgi:hypothetical protein